MNTLRPSLRFRLRQLFWLPWRLVCLKKKHTWHKGACARCLKVDEVRLAAFHVGHLLQNKRFPKRHDV